MNRLLASMTAWLAACGSLSPEQAEEKLQQAVDAQLGKKGARHVVLAVDAPDLGISGAWASGEATEGEPMGVDTPFLSASVGKLFVAAAAVALEREGVWSLDDPVERWVEPQVLAGLPVEGGDAALGAVTLLQLLGHRSGLPDYFEGESRDGSPTVLQRMVEAPDEVWTREALLDYTREHYDPAGTPGAQFVYSDVNYDLVGLAMEGATGEAFHAVVRSRVLEPLQLSDTWYHAFEEGPAMADVWVDDANLGGAASLSVDQAGGGLGTTTADLQRFLRGLVAGEPASIAELDTTTADAITRGIDVGPGLWRVRPRRLTYGLSGAPDLVGVSGATGSFVYYVEEYDAVVAGTFDQTAWGEKHLQFLLSKVVPVLQRTAM
ncbi:MAG: beta-lactamase family protein [Myxococcales bacterium]|nr:beta-lactamase family protein [Myxococcales bacterium]